MKLIVAGSRNFDDYERLKNCLDQIHSQIGVAEVVCGMARGADLLGRKWALESGVAVVEFPADWDGLGKKAGFVRNAQMAEYGTHLIAFWDGESRGTESMIKLAKNKGLKVNVVKV